MTPAEVRKRVAVIDKGKDDDETAHHDEDALHRDVLAAIASGAADASALAAEALKTQDIDFARWYA